MDLRKIQWFPGHMTKAVRMMEDNLKLVDGIIFVLDARAPFACINPMLEKKFGNKPVLYLLNKSDLITERDRDKLIAEFKAQGKKAVACVGTARDVAPFLKLFANLTPKKLKGTSKKALIKCCAQWWRACLIRANPRL